MVLLIVLIIMYPVFLHYNQEGINDFIDFRFSHIVGRCRMCRMFHMGSIQGILYTLLVIEILKIWNYYIG